MINHPHEPNCPGHSYNFELRAPPTSPGFCDELAINGDLENGEVGSNRFFFSDPHWFFPNTTGLVVVPGYDSTKAVQTNGRTHYQQGIYQFLDTRCFIEGKRYEIETRIKMEEACNPNTKLPGNNRCPRASIRSRFNGWDLNVDFALAETLSPFIASEWNTLFGMFTMTKE